MLKALVVVGVAGLSLWAISELAKASKARELFRRKGESRPHVMKLMQDLANEKPDPDKLRFN